MKTTDDLPQTTFSGRRFTRKQIASVVETVELFSNLSREELAKTLCEHLNWKNPAGKLKVKSCLNMMEQLEKFGIVSLPAKRVTKAPIRRVPGFKNQPDTSPINKTLEKVGPITLQQVSSKEDRETFRAYLETYHYLGYKRPFGSYIAYFVKSESKNQIFGCLLFSASASWALEDRDKWIGWEKKHRRKLLHLIISNNRFLIFPWIKIPNLASRVLSLVIKRIGDDWAHAYGYRPVLIETFVDTTRFLGTCYRAANWIHLGKTKGRGRFDPKHQRKETIKEIFVYPLEPDWQHTLTHFHRQPLLKKKYRNDISSSQTHSVDEVFIELWGKVVSVIHEVATQYDEKWQIRKRLINSMLLILLIFRLVCSKNTQSYGTTIDELWNNCRRLNLPLPQKNTIAPSSFCAARKKLDESVFKSINQKIIESYAKSGQDDSYKWKTHRLFAIDGSKLNLPKALLSCGYKLPAIGAHYPQGLLSTLYQVKSQMPFDFNLVPHGNERGCAEQHLLRLKQDDVVVYDRGYFSYLMFHRHINSKIHAVFRLQESSFTVVRNFFSSKETDVVTTIYPCSMIRRSIKLKSPHVDVTPLPIRLIKYKIGDKLYCLGTTLLNQNQYPIQDFRDVYHARWGVEELYKISKHIFNIEDFHAKSERGVKQEVFAHFVLITMNRIFANQADRDLNPPENTNHSGGEDNDASQESVNQKRGKVITNFKNCIHVFARSMEQLILLNTKIRTVVEYTYGFIMNRHQKERPNRSYQRKSMRINTKWHLDRRKTKTSPA